MSLLAKPKNLQSNAEADRRAELDRQTSRLSEPDIMPLLALMRAIARHLGAEEAQGLL